MNVSTSVLNNNEPQYLALHRRPNDVILKQPLTGKGINMKDQCPILHETFGELIAESNKNKVDRELVLVDSGKNMHVYDKQALHGYFTSSGKCINPMTNLACQELHYFRVANPRDGATYAGTCDGKTMQKNINEVLFCAPNKTPEMLEARIQHYFMYLRVMDYVACINMLQLILRDSPQDDFVVEELRRLKAITESIHDLGQSIDNIHLYLIIQRIEEIVRDNKPTCLQKTWSAVSSIASRGISAIHRWSNRILFGDPEPPTVLERLIPLSLMSSLAMGITMGITMGMIFSTTAAVAAIAIKRFV